MLNGRLSFFVAAAGALSGFVQATLLRLRPMHALSRLCALLLATLAGSALAGGTESPDPAQLGRAYYAQQDFENAARTLHLDLERAEKAGRAPAEDSLKLLVNCYVRLNDISGQIWALERLATFYPRKEHWADLLATVPRKSEFGHGLDIDIWRLKLATHSFQGAGEYLAAANLALQGGFAAEARAMLDRGFADGVLGNGPDAEQHRRLKDTVARQLALDKARLAAGELPAAASATPFGTGLVNAGLACVAMGEVDKGLALIAKGMNPPSKTGPQYDRLHQGVALLLAGRRGEASAVFKSVTGRHGTADLARLWYIHTLQLKEAQAAPASRATQ
jgi:hypothetical protein